MRALLARKPRRQRQEGAVGVAIMISDVRGLWHADMIRSAAARPRGAKSATGVLGVVLTRWRLASTDTGINEASGLHTSWSVVDSKQALSGFVDYSVGPLAEVLRGFFHFSIDLCVFRPTRVDCKTACDAERSEKSHPNASPTASFPRALEESATSIHGVVSLGAPWRWLVDSVVPEDH